MEEKTKEIEKLIIEIYYCSIGKNQEVKPEYALFIINIVVFFFSILSIYTNEDHLSTVMKLYFSKDNIKAVGIRKMARILHFEERTLFSLRKKYCNAIWAIIKFAKKEKLL